MAPWRSPRFPESPPTPKTQHREPEGFRVRSCDVENTAFPPKAALPPPPFLALRSICPPLPEPAARAWVVVTAVSKECHPAARVGGPWGASLLPPAPPPRRRPLLLAPVATTWATHRSMRPTSPRALAGAGGRSQSSGAPPAAETVLKEPLLGWDTLDSLC